MAALGRLPDAANHKTLNTIKREPHVGGSDPPAVRKFFAEANPEYVVLAATRVGGIHANNTYPADFLRQNLDIQTSVMETSLHRVERLLFLGSSCIYPRLCPQPIKEEYLLSGPLEPTNRPYAIAKIPVLACGAGCVRGYLPAAPPGRCAAARVARLMGEQRRVATASEGRGLPGVETRGAQATRPWL